jgi:hypothetical protein
MVETPVLFVSFARPEYARQTFNAIKKAKPSKFYFYSNKARLNDPIEIEKNNQIRAFVNEIDWECELKTFFRDEYVGIYNSLWGAYDWVFENEEQAIILEEDCVPSLAFFDFCEQLLPKFKNDLRVWVISGNNYFDSFNPSGYDYIFTRHPFKYGWASWRSRWRKIERGKIPWEDIKRYELHRQQYSISKRKAVFWIKEQEKIIKFLEGKPAWDYMLDFTIMKEGGLGIIPSVNLVKNIGCFGEHSKGGDRIYHNRETILSDRYYIKNAPPFVIPDYKYDQFFFNKYYANSLIHNRIRRKIAREIDNTCNSFITWWRKLFK